MFKCLFPFKPNRTFLRDGQMIYWDPPNFINWNRVVNYNNSVDLNSRNLPYLYLGESVVASACPAKSTGLTKVTPHYKHIFSLVCTG